MKNRVLTLLLICTLPTLSFSQTFFASGMKESLLKGRVKQVEEFMARFNNEEDWEGKKTNLNKDTAYHAQYLRTLFDHSRFRVKNGKLIPQAEQFIRDVVKNNYKIHFTDTTWVAQVDCKAKINRKSTKIKLFLHTRQKAKHEYEWVIFQIECPLLPADSTITHPFISPIEHEIGFTGLLSLPIGEHQEIIIKDITDVTFVFFNVPGYAFSIERLERKNSYNTGWLITNLNLTTNN